MFLKQIYIIKYIYKVTSQVVSKSIPLLPFPINYDLDIDFRTWKIQYHHLYHQYHSNTTLNLFLTNSSISSNWILIYDTIPFQYHSITISFSAYFFEVLPDIRTLNINPVIYSLNSTWLFYSNLISLKLKNPNIYI